MRYGNIIRYFDKTPPGIRCPHFWELNWAYGCHFACDFCYLQGTFRGSNRVYPRLVDQRQVFSALEKFFRDHDSKQLLNAGELCDSLAFPREFKSISDWFEQRKKHYLLGVTKSGAVDIFDGERKYTIFSFSLNCNHAWKLWEHKTPSPQSRIKAMEKLIERGYRVRIRLDPVFWFHEWEKDYSELIQRLPEGIERITLGTPRGLQLTLKYARSRDWAEGLTERTQWGLKLPEDLRYEIYTYLHQQLRDIGYLKDISVCKETLQLWNRLKNEGFSPRCNCQL